MPRLLGRGPRVGLPKWGKCGVCAFGFLKPALPPVLSRPCGRLPLFLSCPFPFRPPAFLPLLFGRGRQEGKGMGMGRKGGRASPPGPGRKGRALFPRLPQAAARSSRSRHEADGSYFVEHRRENLRLSLFCDTCGAASAGGDKRSSQGFGEGPSFSSQARRFPRLRFGIVRPARKNGAREARLARRPRPGEEGRCAAVSLGRFDFSIAFAGFLLK